ncbi:hypothetical protein COCC4DRAFT_192471 [Bipolaris maydis ATCC 48331]|uniref:Uncharacterized protein n=2 Tax=Cochliobolus heterostrophus TaxID=5016 RepID=M2UHD3_COCH5|nr:uncharacterized protein COCC4DRAFT_192471 [Bipolaris maydis ATCC 48331]EMD87388.1 hypothetical protein COCHEDRAFT_1184337 [Bipolaris maydis C5]KAJ5041476.1 hypothetical protein J3E74DRAFT_284160 [Bipolaris maydis]ENI06587.1 hypothetical protein COCC4DRAFT_192471 [Bipolaris maydis ATCC 48331]KAJ5055927.1 hypothetical protein J3E74DRAFT_279938 [Bipolaris maydis]KAJ6193680.1 hypothetical protein J3E72DRAFT_250369 [Bipolaris maydis]
MSPYQHLFSTNAVLGVWRNLRNTKDNNDLLLTLQYHQDDLQRQRGKKYTKGGVSESTQEVADGKTVDVGGKSIGFVVPWRAMQNQRRELKEKEKELAEALIRHLAAGLSRQMSKIEFQMIDNAPFANGKNLYTGGEVAQKFLPSIQALFEQKPVPQRIIFELLMELKDLVYMAMAGCSKEVLEHEVDSTGTSSLEELDDAIVRAITPLSPLLESHQPKELEQSHKRSLHHQQSASFLQSAPEELLYNLESLETTAMALTKLPLSLPDFCAHAIITLRRLTPRPLLLDFSQQKKEKRVQKCAEYARCNKWAGAQWRQNGGCGRGCKNEDEDPEGLPSWHRCSRWFDERGGGTCMVGGGRAVLREDGFGVVRMTAV